MKKLVAGNWKMNGLSAALSEIETVSASAGDHKDHADLLICPPATLIPGAVARSGSSGLMIGGQDCHQAVSGAHTGDVSGEMLKDAGCSHVIVGHSERRADHGETSALVREKAAAAHAAGLVAIICIGESEAERRAGRETEVCGGQLADSLPESATAENSVVAYEPVWAIGTGLVPSEDDIVAMHAFLRAQLCARYGDAGKNVRILYGGSVKPGNAASIMALSDVDGVLVGGASLKASDFLAIAAASY